MMATSDRDASVGAPAGAAGDLVLDPFAGSGTSDASVGAPAGAAGGGVASAVRLYAEVAVHTTFPHRQAFSYLVPDGLDVRVGCAVYVPFGRRVVQGVVVEVHETPVFSPPEKIRPIKSVIGTAALVSPERTALAIWISERYLAPLFDAVALMLPPGFERKPVTIVRPLVDAAQVDGLDLTPRQREALAAVAAHREIEIDDLRADLTFAAIEAPLSQLEQRGLIARAYELARPRIAARTLEVVALAVPLPEARRRIDATEPPKRSRRSDVVEQLLQNGALPVAAAARIAGGRANLDRLVRAGVVRYDRNADNVALVAAPLEAAEEVRRLRRSRRSVQAHAAIAALDAGARPLPELRAELSVDAATVRWLTDLGVATVHARAVERDPLADQAVVQRPPAELLAAQATAAAAVAAALDAHAHRTFLLHGVTGSGKTEVYLEALARCIADGRRAIVLVPEIALTPQTLRRFRERFDRVAVLHSGLSDGELFDQWHGIARGAYDVVIGARSAVFAPQPDVGLIVVDEEHEPTYKQSEVMPRYHARDVALELARLTSAVVVLGSATPDVVSMERADRGASTLLTLPDRVRPVVDAAGVGRPVASPAMPSIRVVDLREELHAGNKSMFSRELREAVEEAVARDEQVLLFLNRRGLANHVQCRDCGNVPFCPSCSLALTFHRQYDRLVCHQCNRRAALPAACRQCGSPRVRLLGAGIEKVEAEAARAFPHARLLRWDRDVTRSRGAHERILARFLARDADILIGTQMVAKSLDLPAVTVVGVISADVGLHLPDFRAGERVFQLITQVAGRAGRGERPGRVIVQTYTPDHDAVAAAARYDYDGFVARELDARGRLGYPPFGRLTRLLFSHTNLRFAREEAARMHRAVDERRRELGSEIDVLPAAPAFFERVRGRWRWHVLLRGRDPASLIRDFVLPPGWTVDVDPLNLL
ncbi:MAG: primosomal protein N' [Dehalococcoidia bacterium]|nr:primosomal protein N' [Dehalococcoidia bacterium]